MTLALELLARRMAYEVPPQDLAIDRTRLPALPRSRFVMRAVRAA
jgi:fatty-acid peroxygenase